MRWCGQLSLAAVACMLFAGAPLRAEDAYYEIPIDQLRITQGELPKRWDRVDWRERERAQALVPYAVLDGEGEIYLGRAVGRPMDSSDPRETALELEERGAEQGAAGAQGDARAQAPNRSAVVIRAPDGRKLTGSLYVPSSDFSGMQRIRFEVAPAQADPKARRNFLLTKLDHYERLARRDLPGAAWFRHQARSVRRELTGKPAAQAEPERDARRPDWQRESQMEQTFALVSGGRAVSENLQLDRVLPTTRPEEPTVPLSSLEGITVREMDWSELTKGADPQIDALAHLIPHDQHALLFPSFRSMVTLMDEAAHNGTPLLFLLQGRAESAGSRSFYERQLCLSIDAVSRLLGDQLVQEVAFTGSDPYLRTGTDVAVLFQTKSPRVLKETLAARHRAASHEHSDCKSVSGKVGGVAYEGVATADRRICSYLATAGDAVVVTNSLAQLGRLVDTARSPGESLAALPEYTFFRERYKKGDESETGLLIVTDATVRRWCGPKWRIATSRRTRAAAILAEHQARHLGELARGSVEPRVIDPGLFVTDLGSLSLADSGVISSTYGSLEFQTPIIELEFDRVTEEEARLYRTWRDGYQRNWSRFFDPIAARFGIKPGRLGADLTVMPLIENSEYRRPMQVAGEARVAPDAGDRHKEALAHWSMAVDLDAPAMQWTSNFLQQMIGGQANPFSWLGSSIALYADEDPFWADLAGAEDGDRFLEQNFHRFPIAFRAEVSNGLKLAAFLTAVRAYVQQTAPNLTRWETLEHNDQSYVRITPARADDLPVPNELAIYYATTPKSLVVTLNETVLKRALDRDAQQDRAEGSKPEELRPWLGESMNLQLTGQAIQWLSGTLDDEYQRAMQIRAWANIPILNEWKRRDPQHDPVEFHARHWQSQLVCPGGGQYVWNEEFETMASTAYGHPGEPKPGPRVPEPLRPIRFANFGVTFENEGLRARAVVEREADAAP